MDSTLQKNNVIPQGELHCVWMDAGLVSYKLCDRKFQCEGCPLDEVMRQHAASTVHPSYSSVSEQETPVLGSAQEYFEYAVENFLSPVTKTPLPDDRLYCRNHTWVRRDSDGTAVVGIDHIGAYFLQHNFSIVLPHHAARIHTHAPYVWIVLPEVTIGIRSAISGTIVSTNKNLINDPHIILHDPYSNGWILRAVELDRKKEKNEFYSSEDFTGILQKEAQTLRQKFNQEFRRQQPSVGTTFHDGGTLLKTIPDILGTKKYFEIINQIFIRL
jgi:glycine cleavage system H protein